VISKELWQDAVMLGPTLQSSIASAAALAIDHACLMGSGNGEEPRGLYYNSGVTQTAATADPWGNISDSMYRVEDENYTPDGVLLSPRSANCLRKMEDANYLPYPRPYWCPPMYSTKQIPDDLSTDKSAVFVGQWDRLWIGIRDTFRLEILREIKSQSGQLVLAGAMRADVGAVRTGAFDIIKDVPSTWARSGAE